MWTGQFFSKIDDNMQMRFLTSLSTNIPKTGYLFKFREKNIKEGYPQGGGWALGYLKAQKVTSRPKRLPQGPKGYLKEPKKLPKGTQKVT